MSEKKETIEIANDDKLYRKIRAEYIKNDEVSSQAFYQRDEDLSVSIANLSNLEEQFPNPDFGLAEIEAGFVRNLELEVCHDPTPEDPGHAIVCGRINKTKARKIARAAMLIRKPG